MYAAQNKNQNAKQNKSSLSMLSTGFPPSNVPAIAWATASSVAISGCSYQVSPLSLRMIWISRSLSRREAKCGTSMSTGLEIQKKKCLYDNLLLSFFVLRTYSCFWQDLLTGKEKQQLGCRMHLKFKRYFINQIKFEALAWK